MEIQLGLERELYQYINHQEGTMLLLLLLLFSHIN